MKKILTLNLGAGNTVANSVTVFGASTSSSTNTIIYNTAQLLDNLNVPLSPLVDVRTSIYDDTAGKKACNVFYKLDPEKITAATFPKDVIDKMTVPLELSTSVGGDESEEAMRNGTSAQYKDNSHAISYGAMTIEDFRNVIFGVKACTNDGDLIIGISGDRNIDITSNSSDGNKVRFTYDFNQRALYKPWTSKPNGNYIWIAWPIDSGHVPNSAELEGKSWRFADVKGYSGTDSPQAIEFTFSKVVGDYILGISDSRFGVGLPYNVIVKPLEKDNGEYYID